MSLVSSLNIAQTALSASQAAITVVSNNIANVDNSSYSKLRVNLADVVNSSTTHGSAILEANSLAGVQVTNIDRYSDWSLETSYLSENSSYYALKQSSTIATNVQSVMNELEDSGLSDALSTFYTAVNALSSSPSDSSARASYVSAAENVCSVFNSFSSSLNTIQQNLVGDYTVNGDVQNSEIADQVNSVNDLLDQIADVNQGIIKANMSGSTVTSLEDTRDALIESLSQYTNFDVEKSDTGTVSVSLGGTALVTGGTVQSYLSVSTGDSTTPAVVNLVDKDGNVKVSNVNDQITGGTIGGILDLCSADPTGANFTIPGVLSELDTMASEFANIMNTIQVGDPSGDGTTAMCLNTTGTSLTTSSDLLFVNSDSSSVTTSSTTAATVATDKNGTVTTTTTDASGQKYTNTITTKIDTTAGTTTVTTVTQAAVSASNISVNSSVISDSYLVAAARLSSSTIAAGNYSSSTGNNSNVTLITNARDETSSALDNQSVEDYLSSTVTDIGTAVSSLSSSLKTQNTLLSSISSQLTDETAVNLDEELTDMIKYQRSYEAAARVFSTCNDLLEQLVNLGK